MFSNQIKISIKILGFQIKLTFKLMLNNIVFNEFSLEFSDAFSVLVYFCTLILWILLALVRKMQAVYKRVALRYYYVSILRLLMKNTF